MSQFIDTVGAEGRTLRLQDLHDGLPYDTPREDQPYDDMRLLGALVDGQLVPCTYEERMREIWDAFRVGLGLEIAPSAYESERSALDLAISAMNIPQQISCTYNPDHDRLQIYFSRSYYRHPVTTIIATTERFMAAMQIEDTKERMAKLVSEDDSIWCPY